VTDTSRMHHDALMYTETQGTNNCLEMNQYELSYVSVEC